VIYDADLENSLIGDPDADPAVLKVAVEKYLLELAQDEAQ
jgi:hypothetical protein